MMVLLIGLNLFCVLDLLSDDHSTTYHTASKASKNTSNSKGKSKFSLCSHFHALSLYILYTLNHIYVIADVDGE